MLCNRVATYDVSDLEVVVVVEDRGTAVPGIDRDGICFRVVGRLPAGMAVVVRVLCVDMTQRVCSAQQH